MNMQYQRLGLTSLMIAALIALTGCAQPQQSEQIAGPLHWEISAGDEPLQINFTVDYDEEHPGFLSVLYRLGEFQTNNSSGAQARLEIDLQQGDRWLAGTIQIDGGATSQDSANSGEGSFSTRFPMQWSDLQLENYTAGEPVTMNIRLATTPEAGGDQRFFLDILSVDSIVAPISQAILYDEDWRTPGND